MEDEKMTCNCTGKVFWGVLLTAVVAALAVGGGAYWWAKNSTSSTASTAGSTCATSAITTSATLDPTKGKWSAGGDGYVFETQPTRYFQLSLPINSVIGSDNKQIDINKDEWNKFIKTAKAVQGDTPNIVNIVFPTTDKNFSDGFYTYMKIGVFTLDEWKAIAAKQEGPGSFVVIDVNKDGLILAYSPTNVTDAASVPSDFPNTPAFGQISNGDVISNNVGLTF